MERLFEQRTQVKPRMGGTFSRLCPAVPTCPLFLPTTSPLSGGLMLRVHAVRDPQLLAPNVFGSGVLVATLDQIDDLGFRVTGFDRYLLTRLARREDMRPERLGAEVLRAAVTGFAGREAQVLAQQVIPIMARRRAALRTAMDNDASRDALPSTLADPITSHRLAAIWAEAGLSRLPGCAPGTSVTEGHPKQDLNDGLSVRLQLLRQTDERLSRLFVPGAVEMTHHRLTTVARAALRRIVTLYEVLRGMLSRPDVTAGLHPLAREYAPELAVLRGWFRFCFLTADVARSPSRTHALADLVSLAQLLTHRPGLKGDEAFLANAVRPKLSDWPPEIDHAVYITERNERILRAEMMLDIGVR